MSDRKAVLEFVDTLRQCARNPGVYEREHLSMVMSKAADILSTSHPKAESAEDVAKELLRYWHLHSDPHTKILGEDFTALRVKIASAITAAEQRGAVAERERIGKECDAKSDRLLEQRDSISTDKREARFALERAAHEFRRFGEVVRSQAIRGSHEHG